ncbi:enoyl-CoA hydratase-related protein [Pararobbsia silviterrae]|nr:enoyl-CoA hydratase-related protein [Pararobbsia silviterrae]
MSAELKATQIDTTWVLTISNPGAREPSADVFASAIEALDVAERDDETRAVVVTGLDALVSVMPSSRLARRDAIQDGHASAIASFAGLLDALRTFSKPVIATIERQAEGAGLALALACDLIVADEAAHAGLPRDAQGSLPDSGVSWFAARTLPKALANEMILTGAPIEAARLYAAGIVNKLAAHGEALQLAIDWASEIGRRAPNAFADAKRLLEQATDRDLQSQMTAEGEARIARLR